MNVADILEKNMIDSSPGVQSRQATGRMAHRLASYKTLLLGNDLLFVLLAFGIGGWLLGEGFFMSNIPVNTLVLGILAAVVFAFFSDNELYAYHRIFIKKVHALKLLKAMSWSLLTLALIATIYLFPQVFSKTHLFVTVPALAVIVMVMSRFFGEQMLNLLKSLGISFLLVGAFGLLAPETNPIQSVGWPVLVVSFAICVGGVSLSRFVIVHLIFQGAIFQGTMKRRLRRQTLVIGADDQASSIASRVIEMEAPYWIMGNLGTSSLDTRVAKDRLGSLANLPDLARENLIDEIILTDDGINRHTLIRFLDFCTTNGITVWFPQNLMPVISAKVQPDHFCNIPMIRLCTQQSTWIFDKTKHALDSMVALPTFVALLPFFAIVGAVIKLTSPGPVFYRATAIGKGGRTFSMLKFRSMRSDTDAGIHKAYVTRLIRGEIKADKEGQPLKIVDDPRITAIGCFLRKFSLDELPQIINVLKGDMSLVGPRPCLPYEYEIYKDWHKKRTAVRPGITGLWQVTGRSEVAFEDMILLDLYYIYNRNLMLDLNIIYETVFVVLGKRGAY